MKNTIKELKLKKKYENFIRHMTFSRLKFVNKGHQNDHCLIVVTVVCFLLHYIGWVWRYKPAKTDALT